MTATAMLQSADNVRRDKRVPESLWNLMKCVIVAADIPVWLDNKESFKELGETPRSLLAEADPVKLHKNVRLIAERFYRALAFATVPGLPALDILVEKAMVEIEFGTFAGPSVPGYPFLTQPQASGEIGRLGNYRVFAKLGEGVMAFVFRAEDPALKRFVALKVMKPEVAAKPLAANRFLREGRAAASLKSDHIITIYRVGQENGAPFIAMEYLEGTTLDKWIIQQKNAVPVLEVVRVVRDTLRGLATAHEKGLIHRDIKPANLWIEKSTARIKLLDFGLTRTADGNDQMAAYDSVDGTSLYMADGEVIGTRIVQRNFRFIIRPPMHTADAEVVSTTAYTVDGEVVGTTAYSADSEVAYMAPEQAAGKPVDERAGLFSLGMVMYKLIAGKNPFVRNNMRATMGEVSFDVQPPVVSLRPEVPQAYSDYLDRLLAKDPAGRPASATAALAELAAIEKSLQDSAKTLASTSIIPAFTP